jgi:membrane-associated protease RseP (regulator of RpoE activity)
MSEVIREAAADGEEVPVSAEGPQRVSAGRPDVAEPDEQSRLVGVAVLVALLAWLGIAAGWAYIVVVLALVFMITMHELGHYLAARHGGMKVTEFFLGFGPRLWSFRRGETEYGIKGIWAGAYVKVVGMNNLEEVDPVDEPRTYRQQSYPKRMLVAVAGSGMHFLMALIAIYAVLVSSGLEFDLTQWTVSDVPVEGAAFDMGIEDDDRVVGADGIEFATFDDMRRFVEPRAGENVTFEVLRGTDIVLVTGTIGVSNETGLGLLGVASSSADLPRLEFGPLEAVPKTFETFGRLTKDTVVSIGQIFSPSGLFDFFSRLDGEDATVTSTGEAVDPDDEGRILSLVGATRLGAQLTEQGITGLLVFFLSINVFVGVINLAPLLPLDGGHVVIGTYERLRSRNGQRYHADVAKALPIAYMVVMLLTTVGLAAIYLDIADPISF